MGQENEQKSKEEDFSDNERDDAAHDPVPESFGGPTKYSDGNHFADLTGLWKTQNPSLDGRHSVGSDSGMDLDQFE